VPNLIRHLPQHKPWMVAISVIATVVVLAFCSFGSYLLVRDDTKVVGADPTPTTTAQIRDISDRRRDPKPLAVKDVFPGTEIVADPTIPPYKRMGAPQIAQDCRVAATGEVGKLLNKLGCTQVVRATWLSPDGGFYVTAGIFNLTDTAAATQALDQVKTLMDASKGRFTGYIADAKTKILGRAPTNLAWDAQGHFFIYAVMARVDGKAFGSDDPHVPVMVYDIVQKYLRDKVLVDWAIEHPTTASPAK
jgi:hypothetical protein